MTNAEAREKLCPFSFGGGYSKFCQGTGCMAFKMSHAEVKMQNHGESTLSAMLKYAEARGRTVNDITRSVEWMILDEEYDCRRLYDLNEKAIR